MFDISLAELVVIFFVGIMILKPNDIMNIFVKLKGLNYKFRRQSFLNDVLLDLKEESSFEESKANFKNEKQKKSK
jgi:Sec-independent protein translocase protein TatA